MRFRFVAAALFLLLAACSGTKREASAVVGAVDRYRAADNDHKSDFADAIANVPCSATEVCVAKQTCFKAAAATSRGLRLQHEVAKSLGDVEAGRATATELATKELGAKLDESTRLMSEGQTELEDCDEKVTSLRIKYSL